MPPAGTSLSEALLAVPQRESAGRTSADRFDYQKNWTLCLLLDLHHAGNDYVVLCEYHEDVTVLDGANDPKSAKFYQVKTDASNRWTLARLTKRMKAADGTEQSSILGKLCGKAMLLPGQECEFRFASNAKYRLKLKPEYQADPPVRLLGSMLDENDASSLTAALSAELGVDMSDVVRKALAFEVATLPLHSHNQTAMGMLADFMDKHAKGCNIAVAPLYRSLVDEIKRRTSASPADQSIAAICHAKGISKSDFGAMLNAAVRSTPSDRIWATIVQSLIAEAVPLDKQRLLNRAFNDYYIRQLNPADVALSKLRDVMLQRAATIANATPSIGLHALAEAVLANLIDTPTFKAAALSAAQALVMFMVEFYEAREPPFPSIDSQSPQGEP